MARAKTAIPERIRSDRSNRIGYRNPWQLINLAQRSDDAGRMFATIVLSRVYRNVDERIATTTSTQRSPWISRGPFSDSFPAALEQIALALVAEPPHENEERSSFAGSSVAQFDFSDSRDMGSTPYIKAINITRKIEKNTPPEKTLGERR